MRRKHHRRYQGRFTRLASRYRSLFTFALACLGLLSVPGFNGSAHAQSATYQVTFEGKFTASALASGVSVPSGEHFTTLIGAVHNGSVTFWSSGGTASAGVEAVAELGTTGTFKSEINANINAATVFEQSIASGGTATATVDIVVTTDHPRLTLLSMVAPSPDWFVGRCCVIRARGEPGREAHPPQYTRSDRGIPSSAIRFSTAHLIAASTFWFLTVRAERLTPSIALYRETAFSATLWRVQPLDFRHS